MAQNEIISYLKTNLPYLLLQGEVNAALKEFPDASIDCVITSPPYWNLRDYDIDTKYEEDIIGTEKTPAEYVERLRVVFSEIKRIITPRGSFWLNIGDKYNKKNLMGMPWRVALALQDDGWILRNDIIWDQMKGTQSAKDRFRDSYEHLFHFVKKDKYFFDADSIRIKPTKTATITNNKVTSATGVSGKKYRVQIEESKDLNAEEKKAALQALDETICELKSGRIVDFRMTIRGQQRTFHSDKEQVSGRAKELLRKGYYFLKSGAAGFLPDDIWKIVPEDEWRTDTHCAVFPVDLLKRPILSTCPKNGLVLDPFIGTGSTIVAANKLGRRGIGIDISDKYIAVAKKRIDATAPLKLTFY